MVKRDTPILIWAIIIFWILFFIYCNIVTLLAFRSHWIALVFYIPLGILSFIFAFGIFRQKVAVFRIARWFNLIVLVAILFLLAKGGDGSDIVFYISVISIFGLMQAAYSSRKVKIWFEHPEGVPIREEKRA